MAVLLKDGLKIELSNVSSLYTEEDDRESAGTYETFSFHVQVLEEDMLSSVMEEEFEVPSGNILNLIFMIGTVLTEKTYQELVFVEPDFSFESFPLDESGERFRFCWWVNSGTWEGIYSSTHIGFRFDLTRDEFESFLSQLHIDWMTRTKLPIE